MRCEYCDVEVVAYPESGLCACCGAKLPPRPVAAPVPPVNTLPVEDSPFLFDPAPLRCPYCQSTQIQTQSRGFSWGLAILGLFLFSLLGLLMGFIGSKKTRCYCSHCGRKWTCRH